MRERRISRRPTGSWQRNQCASRPTSRPSRKSGYRRSSQVCRGLKMPCRGTANDPQTDERDLCNWPSPCFPFESLPSLTREAKPSPSSPGQRNAPRARPTLSFLKLDLFAVEMRCGLPSTVRSSFSPLPTSTHEGRCWICSLYRTRIFMEGSTPDGCCQETACGKG
jgi:hypothetical protein